LKVSNNILRVEKQVERLLYLFPAYKKYYVVLDSQHPSQKRKRDAQVRKIPNWVGSQ
jgi:hypothetical protein